jgi:hypothetical protein
MQRLGGFGALGIVVGSHRAAREGDARAEGGNESEGGAGSHESIDKRALRA